jgi:hypothetical protein
MLTNTEKQILGYMVDMGNLRGQDRVNAGQSDTTARELITIFTTQMQQVLPMQIAALKEQKLRAEEDINKFQTLLGLLE